MKTTRCVLGALLLGGPWALGGCGAGTYHIPNVEPVVKPKPEDDLLGELGGEGEETKATPAAAPAEEKPKAPEAKPEPKPEAAKPEAAKPEAAKADAKTPTKADPAKVDAKKAEPAKAADAKKPPEAAPKK